jgi:hypothetical protein
LHKKVNVLLQLDGAKKLGTFFLCWLIFIQANGYASSEETSSQVFTVRGTATAYAAFNRQGNPNSGTPQKIAEADFTAIVDTKSNTYLISITQPPPTENAVYRSFFQVGSDGLDHYVLKKVISTNNAVVATSAEVGKGLFPYRAEEFQQDVWLLCVLDHLPLTDRTNLIQASRQLKFLMNNNLPWKIYETETYLFSDNTNFIQSIRYYHPGFDLGPDGKKAMYAPPDDKGFITASFEKGPITFPELGLSRRAVFTIYIQTHYITNRDDVPPFTWDEISVISCQKNSNSENLMPKITSGTHIDDYRFSDELGHSIGYSCENDEWILRNNENLQKIYRELEGYLPAQPVTKNAAKYWIRAVLLFLVIVPPAYVLWINIKKKRTSN